MYVKNLYASTIYKGIYVLLCAAALIVDFGIPQGLMRWHILNYYTVLSNIACLAFFTAAFAAGVRAWRRGEKTYSWRPRTEGAVVFCIAVTGLIYALMLGPDDLAEQGAGFFSFRNMMLHYAGPVMVALDWLLFNPKGRFCVWDPLKWLSIPLAYFVYILVRSTFAGPIGGSGSRFPYAFIDPAAQGGWGNMMWGVLEIAVELAALGYVIYLIDWLLAKRTRNEKRRMKNEE